MKETWGLVSRVDREPRSSHGLVRSPLTRLVSPSVGGGSWRFAVCDPEAIAQIRPTSPQLSVLVDVLGSTRESLTQDFTMTGQDAVQPAPVRVFHRGELVGVRAVDGELRVAKLYEAAPLVSALLEGDVWLRGVNNAGGGDLWLDEAIDYVQFFATDPPVIQFIRTSRPGWTGLMLCGVQSFFQSGIGAYEDRFWPFLPQPGQSASDFDVPAPAAMSIEVGSFAFPPNASTGFVSTFA